MVMQNRLQKLMLEFPKHKENLYKLLKELEEDEIYKKCIQAEAEERRKNP
jgi:hypothetical protein